MTGSRSGRKTPQEKKALSLALDRRNAYGENDKSSRVSIRLRKRLVNRSNRRADRTLLVPAADLDPDSAERAEYRLRGRPRRRWQKAADIPLAEHLARRRR